MKNGLEFNSNSLEYTDSIKRYSNDGQEYTLKSILTDFRCSEILRYDNLVIYNHVFRATRNMYLSFYNCVHNNIEIASAVVAHLIRPWKTAQNIEKVNVYAGYSQNKFDIQMLDLCLNDTLTPSNISSLYTDQALSVLVRLHSNKKGVGRILALAIIDDTSRFRTNPNHLWLEASGYSKEMIDTHLGLLVEPTGKSLKLGEYYMGLGFIPFNTASLDTNNKGITLRDRLSYSMYLDLSSDIVRGYKSLLGGYKSQSINTTFRKHINKEARQHLLANISGD